MQRYALLSNGTVANVTMAEADPDGEFGDWVPCGTEVGIGWKYLGEGVFTAPPVVIPIDPYLHLIDTGPWKDRFDIYGYPGLKGLVLALGRTNDICYAANADLVDRKYVDLLNRRAELLSTLAKIATVVATTPYPPFTEAMRLAMVDTPVLYEENAALRSLLKL